MRKMDSKILFNYSCSICDRDMGPGKDKYFSVIYKITGERILVCGTCLRFINEAGINSSYEAIRI